MVRFEVFAGAAALSMAWASVSHAQEQATPAQPENPAPAAAAAPEVGMGDIVVTAQKRSERLVDVPISITAVTGQKLAETGILTTQDLAQVVPALRIDLSGAFAQPTVRGVGSALAGPGLASAVATYIDGFYRPSALTNNFEFADLDSIQVLKGPQGTLFGRNATGGAIVVTTANPSHTPNLRGTASYGRYNDVRLSLAGSTGLTDNLAIGISGLYHHSDNFVRDIVTGKKAAKINNYDIRVKLLWEPSDYASFLLTAERFFSHDDSSTAYNSYQGRNALAGVPGVIIAQNRGEVALDGPRKFQARLNALTLKSEFDLDVMKLTSFTSYYDEKDVNTLDFDATAVPLLNTTFPFVEKTFTQEFNLSSKGQQRLTWVAGLYYFYDNGSEPSYVATGQSLPGGGPANFFDVGVKTNALAAFADATYELVDNLFITAGGRYSHEDMDSYFIQGPPGEKVRSSASFHGFTPRAVIRYNLSHSANIYASWSKGFKSGGFSPTAFDTTPFRPEKITAYEAGFKMSRRNFRAELSGFYYDYSDLQVANYISGVAIIRNAASSEIYGADAQFMFAPTSKLRLELSGAYTHARYKNFQNAQVYVGTGQAGDPIRVLDPAAFPAQTDLSGKQMQRSPTLSGTISATYTQPVGDGNIAANASYYRTGSFNFDPAGSFRQDAYGILNGRITYNAPGDRWNFAVWGKNLTDSKYISAVLPFETAILTQWGLPVTYGVEVGFKF